MEAKFTKEEWILREVCPGQFEIANPDKDFIDWKGKNARGHSVVAHVTRNFFSKEETEANAKLIAAAPELLQACHNALMSFEAMNTIRENFIPETTIRELKQAIKKATE